MLCTRRGVTTSGAPHATGSQIKQKETLAVPREHLLHELEFGSRIAQNNANPYGETCSELARRLGERQAELSPGDCPQRGFGPFCCLFSIF
jgi:hypothetical protein